MEVKEEGVDPLADYTGANGKKVDGSGDLVTNHCHHTTLEDIRKFFKAKSYLLVTLSIRQIWQFARLTSNAHLSIFKQISSIRI